jgi:hypothetical protein
MLQMDIQLIEPSDHLGPKISEAPTSHGVHVVHVVHVVPEFLTCLALIGTLATQLSL